MKSFALLLGSLLLPNLVHASCDLAVFRTCVGIMCWAPYDEDMIKKGWHPWEPDYFSELEEGDYYLTMSTWVEEGTFTDTRMWMARIMRLGRNGREVTVSASDPDGRSGLQKAFRELSGCRTRSDSRVSSSRYKLASSRAGSLPHRRAGAPSVEGF